MVDVMGFVDFCTRYDVCYDCIVRSDEANVTSITRNVPLLILLIIGLNAL